MVAGDMLPIMDILIMVATGVATGAMGIVIGPVIITDTGTVITIMVIGVEDVVTIHVM